MKRLFSLLHRWLGLVSGLIVMVVCLTGSLYVFRDEVEQCASLGVGCPSATRRCFPLRRC